MGMIEQEIDSRLAMSIKSIAWIKSELHALEANLLKNGHSTAEEKGMINYLKKKNQWEDREMQKIMAE